MIRPAQHVLLGQGGAGEPEPPESEGYQVTVSPGTVSADLSGFPLMIDLSDMPASFWDSVNDTGGNVRAYAEDGETPIPHDVAFVDRRWKVGRMFVRTEINAAVGATVRLALGDTSQDALPASDPNGRNAVWADYEVVWAFPEMTNRTGKEYAQQFDSLPPHFWEEVEDLFYLPGFPRQGIATDKQGTFVTIDTNYLRKSGADFVVTATNANPIADSGIAGVDHLGDGCIIGDEIFLPLELYPSGPYTNQHIAVYSLSDLSFLRSYDISAQGHEASGIAFDGEHLYITDFEVDDFIHKYTTEGVFVETISLSQPIDRMQGIEFSEGRLYISSDGTPDAVFEVGLDGTVYGNIIDFAVGATEGLCYDGQRLYLLDGNGQLATLERNYQRLGWANLSPSRIGYATLPVNPTWTASVSADWTNPDVTAQQSFLSLTADNSGSNDTRATLVSDNRPDVVGIWNSTNSWLRSDVRFAGGETRRLAFSHNGTAGRKLWIDGVLEASEASSAARPTGAGNMDFVINAANRSGTEAGENYYQFAWLRLESMGDEWMAAEAANMNTPASFYTITEPPSPPDGKGR